MDAIPLDDGDNQHGSKTVQVFAMTPSEVERQLARLRLTAVAADAILEPPCDLATTVVPHDAELQRNSEKRKL